MRTIALKNPSNDVKRLLAVAKNEDVVVEAPDGEKFMLSPVGDDFDYEIARQRQNKKVMAFLERRFKQARQEKGIPLDEAFLQLGLKPKKATVGSVTKKMKNAERRVKN